MEDKVLSSYRRDVSKLIPKATRNRPGTSKKDEIKGRYSGHNEGESFCF